MAKRHAGWALATMLAVMPAVQASSRIGFSSDDEGSFDIFKTNEDGSLSPVQVTDASNAEQHPTIDPSGTKVIYHVGGALFMSDFKDPISTPVSLGAGYDPTAARAYLNAQRDFTIIYHKGISGVNNGHPQIYVATVDISENALANEVKLTNENAADSTQAAFCGPSHFVWVIDDGYGGALCYQEFNPQGPVGTKHCWFSDAQDGLEDMHPSCDSTGGTIAWVRETENPGSGYEGTHDIWIIDTSDEDGSEAMALHATHEDETAPVWSWDDEWIAFAWAKESTGGDYDIWATDMNGQNDYPVTTNTGIDDMEPCWGPAAP